MPNDRWDAPNIPKKVKLPKGSGGLKERESPIILYVQDSKMFDKDGKYIPKKERRK